MENFNNNGKHTKNIHRNLKEREKRLKPKTKETRSKTQKEIESTERLHKLIFTFRDLYKVCFHSSIISHQ